MRPLGHALARRLVRPLVALAIAASALLPLALTPRAAHAQAACTLDPRFVELSEKASTTYGGRVADCDEPPVVNPSNGNVEQRGITCAGCVVTTRSLFVWRKADGVVGETLGHITFVMGPDGGVRRRLSNQRYSWETDPAVAGAILLDDAPPGVMETQNTVNGVPTSPPTVSVAPPAPAPAPAPNQAACATGPAFTLVESILTPDVTGACVEPLRVTDAAKQHLEQRTTKGLWIRRPDNVLAPTQFTNGDETWVAAGSRGILRRRNTQRFEWEPDATAPGMVRVYPPAFPTEANLKSAGIGWGVPSAVLTPLEAVAPAPPAPIAPPPPASPAPTGWEQRVESSADRGRLVEALAVLRDLDEGSWKGTYLPRLAASNVTIGWGPLPAGVNGQYSPRTRRITVADRHRGEAAPVLAPILAHELVHALGGNWGPDPGAAGPVIDTPADCLNDEITAFEYQGLAWMAIKKTYPAAQNSSALARHHDDVLTAWLTENLGQTVLSTPGYQTQCLGGTVRTG